MNRPAFSLVEVLAALLVLSLGMLSAIGLVSYGMGLARVALARSVGMATAISVAADPTPLLDTVADWTAPPGFAGIARGFINGTWVEREESAGEVLATGLTSSLVTVEVYDGLKGRHICSYQERILRRKP
jgi:prepilin-type N-terminal cleavage/methylation domain-containing protein